MNLTQQIMDLISEMKPNARFDENTELITDGILDSLDIVSLVATMADEFDVEITAIDVIPENMNTAARMAALIERLQDEE